VHAAVDEHRHAAILTKHHDDGLTPEGAGDEVPGAGDLAVVPDEDPAAWKMRSISSAKMRGSV
jgi:hypothetical protein